MASIIINKKQLAFIIEQLNSNNMTKKIIKLTENDLMNIVKRVISEQTETYNFNMAIQCFLNKRGIKDDAGQPLKMDGSIGNYPVSKSAQAVYRYQSKIGVDTDGVWGYNTGNSMPPEDKKIFKQCVSEHGDIFDKGLHMLGLD